MGPRFEAEDLGARSGFELLWRGGRFDQLASFGEEQQVTARQGDRTGAEAVDAPHDFAGLQIDTAQLAAVFLAAMIAVEKSIMMDAGGVMVGKLVVAGP